MSVTARGSNYFLILVGWVLSYENILLPQAYFSFNSMLFRLKPLLERNSDRRGEIRLRSLIGNVVICVSDTMHSKSLFYGLTISSSTLYRRITYHILQRDIISSSMWKVHKV